MPAQQLTNLATSPSTEASGGHPWAWQALALSLVGVWVWTAFRGHTALHHDMAEQFVWAQHWQLGYPKHPPLPTWLFKLALLVFPPVPATLYALAALCMGLTGVFTYQAARALVGASGAAWVLMLWALQQPFTWRAWIYNHNTVLVMTVALTVWGAAAAHRTGQARWWWLAGLGAGLTMATKLQGVVPLLGVLWALWGSGAMSDARGRRGLAGAVLVAAAVSFLPLYWIWAGHTDALAYATHQLGSGEAAGESVRFGQFFATQLRMAAPALLVLLAWVGWSARLRGDLGVSPSAGLSQPCEPVRVPLRPWVQGLLGVPLVFVLLMGLLGGAHLHGQWGVQTFQFLALALFGWFQPALRDLPLVRATRLFAVVQVCALLLACSPMSARWHAPGPVNGYPAAELARRVQADWQRLAPGCPLRFVDAPFFEGGQLAAYLPAHPAVHEAGLDDVWQTVPAQGLALHGGVVLRADPAALPAQALHGPGMTLVPPDSVKGAGPVSWAVVPPPGPCAP